MSSGSLEGLKLGMHTLLSCDVLRYICIMYEQGIDVDISNRILIPDIS